MRFSKNLIQVIFLKTAQKAAKILPRIVQRVDELTVFSNATFTYTLVLPWYNDLLKSLMVLCICVGEPVDHNLKIKNCLDMSDHT